MHSILVAALMALMPLAHASCNSTAETFDVPSGAQRLFLYTPTSAAPAVSGYSTNSLTVMQYNIQSGNSLVPYCVYNYQNNQLPLINSYKPHYWSMQEIEVDVDITPAFCACNMIQQACDATTHNAGFYRTLDEGLYSQESNGTAGYYGHVGGSLFPIISSASHLFTTYTTEMRGVIALVTQPPFLNTTVIFIETHLQYDNETTREGQTTEVVQFAQAQLALYPNSIIILSGDFYTVPGDQSYANLLAFFNNAWADWNGSPNGGFTYPSVNPTSRFDHIWYKRATGIPMKITNFVIPAVTYSDHRPIVATFAFSGASQVAAFGLATIVMIAALLF